MHGYNLAWGLHCHCRYDDHDKDTGVSEIYTANCMFWILVLCSHCMVTICVTGLFSGVIINFFFKGQVSGPVENFDVGIFLDTINEIFSDNINVMNVKFCMIVLFI